MKNSDVTEKGTRKHTGSFTSFILTLEIEMRKVFNPLTVDAPSYKKI